MTPYYLNWGYEMAVYSLLLQYGVDELATWVEDYDDDEL